MPPLVTVVTPVLDDADAAAALMAQMPPNDDLEVIVVDGGNDASLDRLVARHPRARLIRTESGRSHQMNVGAAGAAGEWLLFVHADSRLPEDWFRWFTNLSPDVAGGWFRFAIADSAWQARLIERMVAWRVKWLQLPYGDQGLFVRAHIFRSHGGFNDIPVLEDVEYIRRLVKTGHVVELPVRLHTSSRRWRRDGWFRRSALNATIVALYFAGVSPARLASWYRSNARE